MRVFMVPFTKFLDLFTQFVQMFGGQRTPFFLIWIGRGLALRLRDGLLDFADGVAAPDGQLRGIGKFFIQQKFLSHFQAVATKRRIFLFGRNVAGVVVFAVAAEAEQIGDDQLRAVAGAGAGDGVCASTP